MLYQEKINYYHKLLLKMISDNRKIKLYIQKHGTLNGFQKLYNNIKFYKPISIK